MITLNLKHIMLTVAAVVITMTLSACGGEAGVDPAQKAAIEQQKEAFAQAEKASRRPRVDCTNAVAQMAQLVAITRTLEAERARIRAAQAANDTGNGNFSVKDQALADQLLVQETTNQNAMNANSQAKGDLSRACGIPFGL